MSFSALPKYALRADEIGRSEGGVFAPFGARARACLRFLGDLQALLVTLSQSASVRPAETSWFSAVLKPFFALFHRRPRPPRHEPPAPEAEYGDWLMEEAPQPADEAPAERRATAEAAAPPRRPMADPQQGTAKGTQHYNPNEGLLSVRHLQKIYKKRRVVQDVSLEVRRGEAIGLLGPNGAGKTTVFYMISGLVRPDIGVIEIDGQDVTVLPMYRRARLGIGYLPQEASVFRGLSVEQNILAVLEITQPNRRARAAELESLLEEFDLARLRKSPAIALSGGERRRCEIARSLAGHPSFILLDEPFAGVDPIAVGDIQNLVQHLTQRGIGVLITDHNVRETLGLIDRAYIIHSGQVLTEGTPAEIVANPDVRRLYLGEDFRM